MASPDKQTTAEAMRRYHRISLEDSAAEDEARSTKQRKVNKKK